MPFARQLSALVVCTVAAGAALAQHAGHEPAKAARPAVAAEAEMADAEVRRVDAAKGTILLKHGEIRSLGMSAMTMGFKLRDPKLADGIKAGDQLRFSAVQEGEALVVTRIVKK
jgi:Cu(I)/Ag(I) efflux system membrane protein CusA/SilA